MAISTCLYKHFKYKFVTESIKNLHLTVIYQLWQLFVLFVAWSRPITRNEEWNCVAQYNETTYQFRQFCWFPAQVNEKYKNSNPVNDASYKEFISYFSLEINCKYIYQYILVCGPCHSRSRQFVKCVIEDAYRCLYI